MDNLGPTQKIFWDAWWHLMDQLQEFPKWLRCIEVPLGSAGYFIDPDNPYGFRQELGSDWVVLALVGDTDMLQCWGYYGDDDLIHLLTPPGSRAGVASTPAFLKGTED